LHGSEARPSALGGRAPRAPVSRRRNVSLRRLIASVNATPPEQIHKPRHEVRVCVTVSYMPCGPGRGCLTSPGSARRSEGNWRGPPARLPLSPGTGKRGRVLGLSAAWRLVSRAGRPPAKPLNAACLANVAALNAARACVVLRSSRGWAALVSPGPGARGPAPPGLPRQRAGPPRPPAGPPPAGTPARPRG
jgi:hypothetical protein